MIKKPYDKKILLVDDDPGIRLMLETVLKKEGYTNIITASCGEEAIERQKAGRPDLVVLDVMLPDIDGFEVCKQIRTTSMVPILFLSARVDEVDKLLSYALGGDEYITKPFSPRELIAKISAMLIRQRYYENASVAEKKITFGRFVIDLDKRILLEDNRPVDLTAKEYLLLEYLATNKNITLSKEQITEKVWDIYSFGSDNTLMVHIRHLREKIEDDPSNPKYIKTVKGRGYVFEL